MTMQVTPVAWFLFPGSSAVERSAVNRFVVGSIPTRGATTYSSSRFSGPGEPNLLHSHNASCFSYSKILWPYTGTMFFTVTESALEDLLKGRMREEHPAGKVMRVVWENDDYAFKLDTPEFDDLIFTQDGEQVLLVSLAMNEMLGDMKMDVVNRDGKNHFVMVRVD